MTTFRKGMTGLVIDRSVQHLPAVATVRMFSGGIFISDIRLHDQNQRLPVGKMFTISFEDAE